MTEKILCPWCGHEMFVPRPWLKGTPDMEGHNWTVRAKCRNCNAVSPDGCGRTEQGALNDMMRIVLRRYTPPIKPMTIEDIMRVRYETAAFWIEFAGTYKEEPACHWYLWSGLLGYSAKVVGYCEPWFLPMADYGKTWRCWERKPTDEERSAAEWET